MNTSILSALAEPNRFRIVEQLRDGPRSVGDLTQRLGLSQPLVSKHLRVLSQAGLVKARPVAQQRLYQLQGKPFEDLNSWVESFRRLWETRLDTLEDLLQTLKEEQNQTPKEPQ